MTIHIINPKERAEKSKAREEAKKDFVKNLKTGNPLENHPGNIRRAIGLLGVSLRHNEFSWQTEVVGIPGYGPVLDDAGAIELRFRIHAAFDFLPPDRLFDQALINVAHQNKFHPVRDYLDGIAWDDVPRINTWLTVYAGAEDTQFTRAAGRKWLIAGVRRVRRPGVKFDTMLVFESQTQGRDKSSAMRTLAVKPEWFLDDLSLGTSSKEVIEQTGGVWIVEFAELTGMHTRELEKIKAFLSRQTDKARAAYSKRVQTVHRQFIGAGTTNDREYMREDERRLLPIVIIKFDIDALRRDVDQLWAEAAHYEALGEPITLPESLWADAAEARVKHLIASPVREKLHRTFGEKTGWVTPATVWSILDVPLEKQITLAAVMGKAMAGLGFTKAQVGTRRGGDPHGERGDYYYERGDTPEERKQKLLV